MSDNQKAQFVPVVHGDGHYAMTMLPEDKRWSGRPYVHLYQVVGGPHDGERGGWVQLEALVGRENIERADPLAAVHYRTRKLLQPKRITITLRYEERKELDDLAQARGVTPEQLLEAFVSDLTESIRSNGSDERMHAEQWLNRVVWPSAFRDMEV